MKQDGSRAARPRSAIEVSAEASAEGRVDGAESPESDRCLDGVRLIRRQEQKYEMGAGAAAFLKEEISRRLPLYEFEPGQPTTYITTVYFDTLSRDFYQLAERSYDDNIKIRLKEYYYDAPWRVRSGVSSDAGSAGRCTAKYLVSPYCYLELKQRVAGFVVKKRFGIPKEILSLLLNGQNILPTLLRITPLGAARDLEAVYAELSRYLSEYTVGITSVVNYRRTVYQESEESLRITFDDRLSVYAPPAQLYEGFEALTSDALGIPIRKSDTVIIEIKCPGEYPQWLGEALRHHSKRRFSKFTSGVRLLLPGAKSKNGEIASGGIVGQDVSPDHRSGAGGEAKTKRSDGLFN